MKKEQFKNILLTMMVFLNIVLGSRIMFDKKLWSSDYNFFNAKKNAISKLFNSATSDRKSDMLFRLCTPNRIIVNTGDQTTRFFLNSQNENYNEIISELNGVLLYLFSQKNPDISEISKEDWFTLLKTKTLFLDYYNEFNLSYFSSFLGIKDENISKNINKFSKIIISYSPNVDVYFYDTKNEKYFKVALYEGFEKFIALISETLHAHATSAYHGDIINYSFELNFDKPINEQRTVIKSSVPLISNTENYSNIKVDSVFIPKNTTKKILQMFDVNTNLARTYKETDGTVVYIENNATLKMHEDGLIEYKSKDGGIKINQTDNNSECVAELYDFSTELLNLSEINSRLYLSSFQQDDTSKICFDYVFNDLPIVIQSDITNNAVNCIVNDGFIQEYSILLKNFLIDNSAGDIIDCISALDDTIQRYSSVNSKITINNIYLSYFYKDDIDVLSPNWFTDVENIISQY